jgi:hypothetical protein
VEVELRALSLLGDVVVDLANAKTVPREMLVRAFAVGRDIEILVPAQSLVVLTGSTTNGHVTQTTNPFADLDSVRTIRVECHSLLGDIHIRYA